ncbi:unnamed protein product, partial [Adineta ricciae]
MQLIISAITHALWPNPSSPLALIDNQFFPVEPMQLIISAITHALWPNP